MEDQENFILEDADINKNVVTLRELAERRKVLLQKKREILNRLNYQNQPVIQPVSTPLSENQNLPPEIPMSDNENVPLSENFTSEFTTLTTILDPPDTMQSEYLSTPIDSNDVAENLMTSDVDFMCDHSFVNLSDITNLKPLSPDSVEWFPEREMEENKKNRKRRKGDQNNWKRMKNKRQRMMGKEYIGFKKEGTKFVQNDPKPARVMGPLCMSTRCFGGKAMYCSKLTEEVRSEIFNNYWKMTWQEKKMYISSMVDKKPTCRRSNGSNSRRSDTKIYYLKVNDKKERVCLKTFLETLGIKEWTVRYWLGDRTNMKERETTEVIEKEPKRELAKKYLAALPKLPSHYCRQSTSKLYLEPIIQSKSQLYRLYVDYSASENKPVASRKVFESVLFEENIGLFQPKKDACDLCCAHKVGNLSDEQYAKHIERKDLARAEKRSDKELAQKGIIHALTADLQAVKLCPFLNASALYFKTKLAVHNFSVYNLGNNGVTCYWFDETACDLKATTYASFFVDYVTKLLDSDCKDVVIFTDGCTAQNRNNVVSNALLRLAMSKNVVITQKYLEKGHTQMEVDSVHSVIERKLKNREVFLPSQYATITKEARKVPSPYEVITPDYTFFKDFGLKDYLIYDSIRPGRGAGDRCVIDIKALKYNPNGTIEYKLHFSDDFVPLPRRPKKITSLINSAPLLYESRQPISKTKYDHLQELKNVIPKDCHTFYDNLPFK
uniref:SFRICE_019922 n=1 Tax=Spodoptera frugiperda TaxID=7108 RepID=A0A2H1WLH6_SPOFR